MCNSCVETGQMSQPWMQIIMTKLSLLLKKYTANNNPLIPPISNFNVKKHCRQENVLSKAQQTISPFLRILAV